MSPSDHETIAAKTTVGTAIPCLFAPANSGLMQTFAGAAEYVDSLLFVDDAQDIEVGDEVKDETTLEYYTVTDPPITYYDPTTWLPDHKQCKIRKIPVQPAS